MDGSDSTGPRDPDSRDPNARRPNERGHDAQDRRTPNPDPRRALGAIGEQLAAEHLQRLDFAIVARNVRTRHGEIDLIAFDEHTLVFVEVKCRRASNGRSGMRSEDRPLAWLKYTQRSRLRRLAQEWLYDKAHARPKAQAIRFDAIGVIVDGCDRLLALDHIEGAW